MSQEDVPTLHEKGPVCYEYWKAVEEGYLTPRAAEYAALTDAWITGEDPEGYGPYHLLNTLASPEPRGEGRMAAVLRVESPESRSEKHFRVTGPRSRRHETYARSIDRRLGVSASK